MKKRLDERVLIAGDIALTTTDALISRTIRKFTSSTISHAMLCVTHSSIVHADSDGVHAENTQRIFFKPNASVHVKRFKGGLPTADARKICDYVRSAVGTEYSVREAMRVMAGGRKDISKKQFCSRLIAQAYDKFGYPLVTNPNYCSPQHILESEMLEDVANPTIMVSDEEYEWYKKSKASPEETKKATNNILINLRKLDRNIQSMDDVNKFVILNPQYDSYVDGLFQSSGYLDLWKLDYTGEFSWRLDLGEMESIPATAGVRRYCESTMAGDARDNNRYVSNLAVLQQMHNHYPRKVFETLIRLYSRLVFLHAQRYDVAQAWLNKHP